LIDWFYFIEKLTDDELSLSHVTKNKQKFKKTTNNKR